MALLVAFAGDERAPQLPKLAALSGALRLGRTAFCFRGGAGPRGSC